MEQSIIVQGQATHVPLPPTRRFLAQLRLTDSAWTPEQLQGAERAVHIRGGTLTSLSLALIRTWAVRHIAGASAEGVGLVATSVRGVIATAVRVGSCHHGVRVRASTHAGCAAMHRRTALQRPEQWSVRVSTRLATPRLRDCLHSACCSTQPVHDIHLCLHAVCPDAAFARGGTGPHSCLSLTSLLVCCDLAQRVRVQLRVETR